MQVLKSNLKSNHISNKHLTSLKVQKSENSVENKFQLQLKKKYFKNMIKNIYSVKNVNQLQHIFKDIFKQSSILNLTTTNFYSDIYKIDLGLSEISNKLKKNNSEDVLENTIKNFINKNKPILYSIDKNLYSSNYIKNKFLNKHISENFSTLVTSDIMKTSIKEGECNLYNYKKIEDELQGWLFDVIYNQSNKKYIQKSKNSEKNIPDSSLIQEIRSIPYLGKDDSYYTQINILHDRKKEIERQRRDELIILNKKYPLNSRNIFNTENRHKNIKSLALMDKKSVFSKKDMTMPYGNHITYEDKIYAMTNIFYNRKYLKIDDEEKNLIKKYKVQIKNKTTKQLRNKLKDKIYKDFNFVRPLNSLKFWNSQGNRLKKIDSTNFDEISLQQIFSAVANKSYMLLNDLSNKKIIDSNVGELDNVKISAGYLKNYGEELKVSKIVPLNNFFVNNIATTKTTSKHNEKNKLR